MYKVVNTLTLSASVSDEIVLRTLTMYWSVQILSAASFNATLRALPRPFRRFRSTDELASENKRSITYRYQEDRNVDANSSLTQDPLLL